ncbi:MAG: hypothetical protein V7L11_28120 [Nostoc sp.]|uniref:hypothetical protein n=1 Tax=Nostoc sp. TaxID=1180 RepID=UPI002FFB8066
MQSGKELKSLVKDGRPLEKYPAISPIFALDSILNEIKERNQFQGHQVSVNSVSFSPDGKTNRTFWNYLKRSHLLELSQIAISSLTPFSSHGMMK